MTKPPASPGWQPDVERDSLVFRLLDLGRTLLDRLHDDPEREGELISLLSTHVTAQAALGRNLLPFDGFIPVVMVQISAQEILYLGRLEGRSGYALALQGDGFAAMARLLYDVEAADLIGGTLLSFRGDPTAAARWIGLLTEAVREGEIDPFLPLDPYQPGWGLSEPANQP